MKILAVDLGDARTGLACCDRTEYLASPIGVLHQRNLEVVAQQVATAVVEYDAGRVVVGYPLNMNGSAGPRAQRCAQFADRLRELVQVPVVLWDERGTTVSGQKAQGGGGRGGGHHHPGELPELPEKPPGGLKTVKEGVRQA
mgnify:CR=1 FL=1